MKPHKWAKEIKAWADGADIEFFDKDTGRWLTKMYDGWDIEAEYRIKPQPKEPQYLYVYGYKDDVTFVSTKTHMCWDGKKLLGKIKLEQDDEPT